MYKGNKNGFSIIKFLLFCLIFLFCLFLIMGIVKKNAPKLDHIYDGIFRDNINSMQDAGEAYFTNDKLPKEIGEEVKISLQEMLDKNYILPFTDKNGDECSLTESYSKVVKTKDGYELRTFLKCGEESHLIVKVLGCHNLCEDNNCSNKTCTREKILQYQFYKLNKVTKTVYSCAKGKLSGSKCIISYVDTKKASTKTTTKTESKTATPVTTKTKVQTIVTPGQTTTVKVDDKVTVTTTRVTTDPQKKTEEHCTTERIPDPNCHVQCVPTYVNGILQDVCNTCGYVSHKKCTDVDVWVCPDGYTKTGSGSSTQCYKDVPSYSCPSESTNHSGSGTSLKCWHYKTTQGSSTYSCPSNSNYSEGTGSNLVCYVKSTTYKCDNGWTLKNGMCYKTTTTTYEVCDTGYKLSNGQCTKNATKKVNASSKKVTSTNKVYKWSKSETLDGWTRTGKTKEVLGKEVCE